MLADQLTMFSENELRGMLPPNNKKVELLPLTEYDLISVQLSGGKDSIIMVLWLLEQGVEKEKIELSHQHVDGYDMILCQENGQKKLRFFL
ncbi:hypothetical protein AWH56_012560 [Anaerobacillus isosaccharinicus]|uniref:Phosphoadenosine phosphosulphate reductase domain-containing protein n=1 Tax=Anaerobacillus isosaccharinicus TaxID=1532552 RepID=A0A1S2L1H4_9BACI|nr:hypothetical protein [Anaerobacillus isosaccharinicus]MBA5588269.1 hypothetical protein [Anaerobacillus isosaccharinicus]QOY38289.1 hypothetical protein AWH56_012560 [Anaerobacillus isosaccharinicus]